MKQELYKIWLRARRAVAQVEKDQAKINAGKILRQRPRKK